MTTQSTFFILQYYVKNEKNDTMIWLLVNSRIRDYNLLIVQEFWRKVCVSTSYNSFNTDFHLLYQKFENVRICFYFNIKLNVNHWSIDFVSKDVCIFILRIANDRRINVHNVYSASSSSYDSRNVLSIVKTMKSQLNVDEKHVVLKNFNLHHFS